MERRQHPRVKVQCPISIITDPTKKTAVDLTGKTIDVSEGGICLVLEEPLPAKNCNSLLSKIQLFPYHIEAYIELIWNQPLYEEHRFIYGGKFINLSNECKKDIQKIIWLDENFIEEQLQPVMDFIDKEVAIMKKRILFFFQKDARQCIQEFIDLKTEGIENLQQEINNRLDHIGLRANELNRAMNQSLVMKEIKQRFRAMIGNWIYKSKIIQHATEKPYGYPGDYKLLEAIYNDKAVSEKGADYLDRYLLGNPYAVAVRNRKDQMKYILKEFIASRATQPKTEIVNLACGSCREIRELYQDGWDHLAPVSFTCIDFEEEALTFSQQKLKKIPKNVTVKLAKENIFNFARRPENYIDRYGNKDLFYSIGLADYLPDQTLKKLIKSCYTMIKPRGKLIIAFKDRNKNEQAPMLIDWYCDWHFVPRNIEKAIKLIEECNLQGYSRKTIWEKSGIIFFLAIAKNSQ